MCIRDRYGENQTYVLKPGDNISLSFTTSESVDEPSILLKIGGEAIDNSSFSVKPDPNISTDGRHWKATYQISQQDSGTLEWMISGIDRVGNALDLASGEGVQSLVFDHYNSFQYEVDKKKPEVHTVVFTEDNAELDRGYNYGKQYDNETSVSLLKSGDNVSLSFKTS